MVVCATSERPAPLRVRACFVALAIAEYFRDQGANVLLVMDSVTRLAMAQREIGLAAGEPPSQKGYTPSVFNLLPKVLERAGNFERGSITGFFTVLVEGDDFNEPICDAVRGILDGHFILSRQLGAQGHYPAIDILHSVSRLTSAIATPAQKEAARKIRGALSAYREAEDLIQLGAYVSGSNPALDASIRLRPELERFPPPGRARHLADLRNAFPPRRTGRASGTAACPTRSAPMTNFRFPLQKALDWRRRQLELEEAHFKQQSAALAELDRRRAENEAAGISAEVEVRQRGTVAGRDLAALDRFRLRVKSEEARIAQERVEAARVLAERHQSMLEARRRARLLDQLRERRLEAWESARDRELEEMAGESFLARWNRRRPG